jgi:hypothetical protein
MKLLSSDIAEFFSTLNDLMTAINEFANDQKYAIVKKRIKINKKEVLRKAILRCDRERNDKLQEFERRKTFSRSCECSFEAVTILQFEK